MSVVGGTTRVQGSSLVWRRALASVSARYAGHSLGWVWHVLNPAAMIVVYSIIFGFIIDRHFESVTVAYPVFLCAAMLPWVFFAEVLNRGCGSLRGNASFLRKLPVGEHLFVAETAVSACVTLVIQMLLLCILATAWGHPPMWTWLAVPLPLAMLAVTGFGLALGLATLNAFFPDVQQVLGTVLRLAIWAAPVVFPLSFYENHGLGGIVQFNPATPALSAVREMFIDGRIPGPAAWGLMLAWAAAALLAGGLIFRALRHEIRDVV